MSIEPTLSPGSQLSASTVDVGELISQIPQPGDGFPSEAEAEHWRLRGCGIACLRMVLDAHAAPSETYWSLVTEGVERGAYCDRGWIHQGLVDMAAQRGIPGRAYRRSQLTDVVDELESGRLVIASVSVCFRGGQTSPTGDRYPSGGHLVLVTGVRRSGSELEAFRVHHPSATPANNWANRWVDVPAVEASFSGNYLAFDPAPASAPIVP